MVDIGQYSFRGLTMGRRTPFLIPGRTGLADLPEVRSNDQARLRRHGEWGSDYFTMGRTFTLSGSIDDDAGESLDVLMDQFSATMIPGEQEDELTFWLPGIFGGKERGMWVKPRRRSIELAYATFGHVTWAVEFHATDPRVYSSGADGFYEATTTLPTAGGGLQFDLDFPLVFGAVATGGSIIAMNSGTFPTPVWMRVDGPFANPSFILVNTGEVLSLNIGVAEGDWLEIDFNLHTVMLNGQASRFPNVTRADWWSLLPGENEVQFRASTQTAALLTMRWRSAWL